MWFALLTFYFKRVKLNYANRISLIGFRVKKTLCCIIKFPAVTSDFYLININIFCNRTIFETKNTL